RQRLAKVVAIFRVIGKTGHEIFKNLDRSSVRGRSSLVVAQRPGDICGIAMEIGRLSLNRLIVGETDAKVFELLPRFVESLLSVKINERRIVHTRLDLVNA